MNPKERVLGPNGFEPFPERLREKAIKQGNMNPPADTGVEEPVSHSGVQGKKEIAKENSKAAEIQKEVEKQISEQKAAKQ
jgi:hypothetical protein